MDERSSLDRVFVHLFRVRDKYRDHVLTIFELKQIHLSLSLLFFFILFYSPWFAWSRLTCWAPLLLPFAYARLEFSSVLPILLSASLVNDDIWCGFMLPTHPPPPSSRSDPLPVLLLSVPLFYFFLYLEEPIDNQRERERVRVLSSFSPFVQSLLSLLINLWLQRGGCI